MANAAQQPKTTTYTVAVKTSDVRNAGTDANVYVQLTGEAGIGQQLQLKTSINHRNKFERNHSDVFLFHGQEPLGALKQLKIWHDNSGIGPGWHLKAVEVNDILTGTTYTFPCNQWLDKTEGDKRICRALNCVRAKQKVAKQLRIGAQQQPAGHAPAQGGSEQAAQVQPVQAPQFGSPAASKSVEKETKENVIVVPKEAPVFGMFPYCGYGYGYPSYGYGFGYPYYGRGFGYGYGYPYYGGMYGYGGYPCYGGGYGLGFGTGMLMGGFMGRSWSWSFF